MKKTPIYALVDSCVSQLTDPKLQRQLIRWQNKKQFLEAVYAFCLNLENHHYLDRRMKDLGIDWETQRIFKSQLKYNQYAKYDFWRGVAVYIRGSKFEKAHKIHGLVEKDLDYCFECLTVEQYTRMLQMASFRSTFRASNEVIEEVIREASKTCKVVADRQLRWIEKVDPGFCGEEELCDEAIRIAYHYAHFPDASRILAYVKRSIYNRANHLCEYHSAEGRRRQRKLPEFRCLPCKKEYIHRKKVLNHASLVKMGLDHPGLSIVGYYCPSCAQEGKVTQLENIEGERVYETMVISIDSQLDEDGRNLGEVVPDQKVNIERETSQKEELEIITRKLRKDSATFVRILCQGDEDFEQWAYDNEVKSFEDPLVVAHLICDYMEVPFDRIKKEVGMVMGQPSVFLVRVDGEDDLTCAQTPWEAVHQVARHYKFRNGHDMQDQLGKVQVKRIGEAHNHYVRSGEVVPMGLRQ